MKWRQLGHLQLLSRAVTVVAEMEVSPQEEMPNSQGMKVFAVERRGLPEDFATFPALCGVQSSPLVFVLNRPIVWGPLHYSGRGWGSLFCASGSRSPELNTQVRRANSCTLCKPAHIDAFITHTGRNGWVCVEDGGGRRPRAFVVWM